MARWNEEVSTVRKIYEKAFATGRLHPHQRMLVVPGLYGNDSATHAEHAVHDKRLVLKLEQYWEWIQNESRIVGLCPYHWQDTPDPPRPGSGTWGCYDPNSLEGNCGFPGELFGLGAKHYPHLKDKMREIGRVIATNNALDSPRSKEQPFSEVQVQMDWAATVATAATAATMEIDVMPFLSRAAWGGPFDAYYSALSNLGAHFVRFAPWEANPRAVVTELTPPRCTKDTPETNWNSTVFDAIMSDFMSAVCGPNAVTGECKLSVVQQLSTMPSWMYVGGMDPKNLPQNPWNTTDPFDLYGAGTELIDPSCGQMARYFGRLVWWLNQQSNAFCSRLRLV
jgi:hypothetical protein